MVTSEREMVVPVVTPEGERFTSLQPTYEDSVPPADEDEWGDDAGY